MFVIPPAPYRKRRRPPKVKKQATPVAPPLTLVSATFSKDDGAVATLVFDRAVSISSGNAEAFSVVDGPDEERFGGYALTSVDPETIRVDLAADGSASGPDRLLTATASNGIVAADDGAAWAGCTDLVIPFP